MEQESDGMKRLTYYESNGKWGVCEMNQMNEDQKMYAVASKLKDYENTGLQPNEVERMKERFTWVLPSYGLPNSDGYVLVQCSGKYNNIIFKNAIQLAEYDFKEKEWTLDSYPEATDIEIEAWMELPEEYIPK